MQNKQKAFTLIELAVVLAVITVLYGVILFSVNLYINKSKDSNVWGNLVGLIPAGEVYYNNNDFSYKPDDGDFCSSSAVTNALSQMSPNSGPCSANASGACCHVDSGGQAWAACAKSFVDATKAYCVDNRGVKKEIALASCTALIQICE